jgi:hypothetical protein
MASILQAPILRTTKLFVSFLIGFGKICSCCCRRVGCNGGASMSNDADRVTETDDEDDTIGESLVSSS